MTGFKPLSRAMFLGFKRDGRALFFTFLFPLMFLVVFAGIIGAGGQAKSKIIEIGAVPLLDQALAQSQDLRGTLETTRTTDAQDALDKVRKGGTDAAVEQQGDRLVVHYSQADQVQAATVQSVLGSVVDQANLQGVPQRYTLDPEQVDDASLEPIQFLTPGMLGWALSSAGMFGAAQTLVTWRTKGILRRLRLSPVPIRTVFGARVLVSLGIALIQTVVFLAVAVAFFGLRLVDDWWMCVPVVLAGATAFLAIGMIVGAGAKTQDSAQSLIQMIVFPMVFLGGSFFPLEAAPGWLQAVSYAVPLRYLNEGMLNVLGRGLSWTSALPQIGILLGIALISAFAATKLFKWDAT